MISVKFTINAVYGYYFNHILLSNICACSTLMAIISPENLQYPEKFIKIGRKDITQI